MKFKKIAAVCLCLCILAGFSACGVTSWQESSGDELSSQAESGTGIEEISDKSYKNNLNGLCEYLKACSVISSNAAEPTEMKAEMVGAVSGLKYVSDVATIELYEFDPDNLNDTANGIISDVKTDGKFVLLGFEANATLSENGKYLMIYTASKSNEEVEKTAKELFSKFKS